MGERDRAHYARVKADPVLYTAYLDRKRRERTARPLYETERKRRWRFNNPVKAQTIRKANHAVEHAITLGLIVRSKFCSRCGSQDHVQAHHRSYKRQHWLMVEWLCRKVCHPQADREVRGEVNEVQIKKGH
jgi:hypothetical protein